MEQVSRYWEETEDAAERTNNKTVKSMCEDRKASGKPQSRDLWRTAINLLAGEGYAKSVKGARDSDVFTVVKPYRELKDPLCDKHSEAAAGAVEGWKYRLRSTDSGEETSAESTDLRADS
jgi:hypothetical protein